MGFLECFKYVCPFCCSLLRGNVGQRTSAHCDLLSGFPVELPGRPGHGPSPNGLMSLSACTSEGKTDSGRSRGPRWASSSESALVMLTSALLPEYFWDLSKQLPLFRISFSQVVRCPGGLEPCYLHSFINGILASSWKKSLHLKCALVSGMLEMIPSQPPCPLPSPQSAALHLSP